MAVRQGKKKWWAVLLAYPTIITGVIGAVPQYTTWAKAYVLNVPWNAVSEAEEQKALWTKNLECSWKEPVQSAKTSVTTEKNERVTVTLCPSGDALVSIQPAGAEPRFRWIGYDRFDTDTKRSAWLHRLPGLRVGSAAAAESPRRLAQAPPPPVICVTRDAKGNIVRRLQLAEGQCQEQVINPYTGAVIEVRAAACTKC